MLTCRISCSGNEGGKTLPSLILTLHIADRHTLVCGGERETERVREREWKVGLEKVEKRDQGKGRRKVQSE